MVSFASTGFFCPPLTHLFAQTDADTTLVSMKERRQLGMWSKSD